jgi:integrase-like protein
VTERARREYAEALRARYHLADKVGKGQILDEYCRVTRAHRKAAIRCLRRRARPAGRPPGRPRRYGPTLLPILERVWAASDYLCGKLLAPMMPVLVAALETHHRLVLVPAVREALLAASPATLDRQLRLLRHRRGRQPRRVAPALHALRAQIPLRTWGEWAGVAPGALQGDLVLHCGESTHGFYLASLVTVDVATSWIELQPLWGVHQERVRSAVHLIRTRLPFPLREWHSDNGSEFINTVLLHWCRQAGVRFTRGRPYRKNDQAWVEQRNWLAVRRLIGYDRYTSRPAFAVLGRLYTLLRLQLNFFRPVRKLLSKQRVGAKIIKRYDPPQTPYQRVVAARILSPTQGQALAAQLAALDPIVLATDIQRTLDTLWKLADPRRHPQMEAARG